MSVSNLSLCSGQNDVFVAENGVVVFVLFSFKNVLLLWRKGLSRVIVIIINANAPAKQDAQFCNQLQPSNSSESHATYFSGLCLDGNGVSRISVFAVITGNIYFAIINQLYS